MKKQKLAVAIIIITLIISILPSPSVVIASQDATLTDIEFNLQGVYNFNPNVTEYTINVPYKYTPNEFDDFIMPNVQVKTNDPEAFAEIIYPDEVQDGTIIINVTAADGVSKKQYTLNLNPIGKNMYADGGFELSNTWYTPTSRSTTLTRDSNIKAAGNYSLKVERTADGMYYAYSTPYFQPNKTYIASSMIRTAEESTAHITRNFFDGVYRADGEIKYWNEHNGTHDSAITYVTNNWKTNYAIISIGGTQSRQVKNYYTNWTGDPTILIDECYVSELVIADVDIKDSYGGTTSQVNIPHYSDKTIQLTAKFLNQFGNKAGIEQVCTWRVAGDSDGINIDESGLLTITSNAQPGCYNIEAVTYPTYTGALQTEVSGRYKLILQPKKNEKDIQYKKGSKTADLLYAGEITSTLTYSNDTQEDTELYFINALYKANNNRLQSIRFEGPYTVYAMDTLNLTKTINVPEAGAFTLKSFVWKNDKVTPLMETSFIESHPEIQNSDRKIIYVSSQAGKQGNGSFENPLSGINEAKNLIRDLKAQNFNPEKGFVVYLREGDYAIGSTTEFTEQDSGTENAPVIYRSYPGETVNLIGGATIPGNLFNKVESQEILNRIVDESARNEIYYLDLNTLGINDVGEPYLAGAYSYPSSYISKGILTRPKAPGAELFFNGKAMQISRYPNDGYLTVESVVSPGWDFDDPNALPVGAPFSITVSDDRMKKWTNAATDSILMYGFWKWDWADQTVPIHYIDTQNMQIDSAVGSVFSVLPGRPFYVYNIIEELDKPGEYYLDHENRILYFYPPSNIENAEITMSILEEELIKLRNASNIHFKNLNIKAARNYAFNIIGGEGNKIIGCEISCTASTAVNIGGYNNGILDSYIHDVNGGISLHGGVLEALIAGNCYAIGNHIHDYSRISKTYVSAVSLAGVGNYMEYNKIHSAPHLAISFSGNNHRIFYNEIFDVLKETDDAGVIYGGLDWVGRGHEINYNYIHDIISINPSSTGLGAVYLDGGQCEIHMEGNVIENIAGTGFWINGGKDNTVINNVIINSINGLRLTDIMRNVDLNKHHYPALNAAYYINSDIWVNAYPKLHAMLAQSDEDIRKPENNIYKNNLIVNSNPAIFWGYARDYIDITQNYSTQRDPGFSDMEGRNYSLLEDSIVFSELTEFENIPFSRMGGYKEKAMQKVSNAIVLVIDSPFYFDKGIKKKLSDNLSITPKKIEGTVYVPALLLANELDNTQWVDEEDMISLQHISHLLEKNIFWNDKGFICLSNNEIKFDVEDDAIISYIIEQLNIF